MVEKERTYSFNWLFSGRIFWDERVKCLSRLSFLCGDRCKNRETPYGGECR